MNYENLLIYCAVSFFYVISPGPAILLAVYNGAAHGVSSAAISAFGNILGLMCLSIVTAFGLSAMLLASSTLFIALKILGAFYLVFLGLKQLSVKAKSTQALAQAAELNTRPLQSFFKEALFVAITNPKPIIFFTALFPQFLDTQKPLPLQYFVMTAVFMMFSYLSLFTYGYLANRAKRLLSEPTKLLWFNRISGGLFVGMGLSLLHLKAAQA